MNRRSFLELVASGSAGISALPLLNHYSFSSNTLINSTGLELSADVVIAGGGLGGCAAALAALRNGLSVVLVEETDWIGGQLTQQGVPPDEHQWIETHGATKLYRQLRNAIRQYYFQQYPVVKKALSNPKFNPGDGAVSRLCHEPKVALAVLEGMLAPYLSSKQLTLFLNHKAIAADTDHDSVKAIKISDTRQETEKVITAPFFVDATELGDLLPLTKSEYVTGTESKQDTGELHAADQANQKNQQAFTMCLAMDYLSGGNFLIEPPKEYNFWKQFVPQLEPAWPGHLLSLTYSYPSTLQPKTLGFHPEGMATGDALNLWNYRRIINKNNFEPGAYAGDISIINWPQNDFMLGNLIDVPQQEYNQNVNKAKQLSLSLFYWLQTEAPRPDGGFGWPGLRLRGDILGTEDGLAKYPYIRESRRIKSVFRVLEEHVGKENRAMVAGKKETDRAAVFYDSVGVGYYHIDLHPSSGGNNYIDFGSLPFQIPLGALLPVRTKNLLPANKNIGTTHITNGCYRLHPVEWSIGEAVGMLVAFSLDKKLAPHAVRENKQMLEDFQRWIQSQGLELQWPD